VQPTSRHSPAQSIRSRTRILWSRSWPEGGSATFATRGMGSPRRLGSLAMAVVATVSADPASWAAYGGVAGAHTTTRPFRRLSFVEPWAQGNTFTMKRLQRRSVPVAWSARSLIVPVWRLLLMGLPNLRPVRYVEHDAVVEECAVHHGLTDIGAGMLWRSSAGVPSRISKHGFGIQA